MKTALMVLLCCLATTVRAQDPAAPLPDVPTLMKQVEANQKAAEDAQQNYIYRSSMRFEKLDSHGDVKKTQSEVDEVFWLNGAQLVRTLEKDGKPLSPEDARKENERIDKEAVKIHEKRAKAESQGKRTDSRGNVIAPLSRYLQLVTLSNERRDTINGRPTILLDFVGDPAAKTDNAPEKFVKELAGTVWIDEQDRVVQRLDGHFVNPFKLGGGLFVNVSKGTHFTFLARKINDEVWLPQAIDGNGHIRVLLLFATEGDFSLRTSDYRKFKASAKFLPNVTPVPAPDQPRP